MRRNLFLVNDGDTVVVIAKAPITMNDPADEFAYVSQAYRIVADRTSPTLQLVPLSDAPVKLRTSEVPRQIAEEAGWKFASPIIEFSPIPPCGGRATGNTTSGS